MNDIDLSKYVGKKVSVTLRDGSFRSGTIVSTPNEYPFTIVLSEYNNTYTYTADGVWEINRSNAMDIVKIEELDDTSTKEQPMPSKEDHIKALEAIGYTVTLTPHLTPQINIDWSKEPAWVGGYIIDADGQHYVVSGDINSVCWTSDHRGWNFNCDYVCLISKELSPLKDYKGHPKNSLHRRPSSSDKT